MKEKIISIPNPNNFCGGNFQDWLEVNLTNVCNAKCSWCIEKKGWHPKHHAHWKTIADQAVNTNKTNIILLGGEPTLHHNIQQIIQYLHQANKKVWITTNASKLSPKWVKANLNGIYGVNLSIHHYNLTNNKNITGIKLNQKTLQKSIEAIHKIGGICRLNCNCINGQIDSEQEIHKYIEFAKLMKVDNIRFAELKGDDDNFVNLTEILNHKYGTNNDPFKCGCNKNAIVNGIPVNFRQMCGLQTSKRPCPINPVQYQKEVLYYDGNVYNGWQINKGEQKMKVTKLMGILKAVKTGKMSESEAAVAIQTAIENEDVYERQNNTNDIHCQY